MGKKHVEVIDVPDPQLLDRRDAIVRVTSTAICGSDLHLYNGFMPTMERGDVLGHEFMGEVVDVAAGVDNLKVGDRVVVPFTISCGACAACNAQMYSLCENSNPNAWMAEKMLGHSAAGAFGYSHLTGGFAGGQAEYVRVPFADVGPFKVPDDLSDEKVLFLSDILPTGYMGAEMCDIEPGDVIAVWGAGPVGLFAAASAYLLGAERVIVIDRFGYRLDMAREKVGAETINYELEDVHETLMEKTGGRGPDGLYRLRRHGSALCQSLALCDGPREAGDQDGDGQATRSSRGDPRVQERRNGLRDGRLWRLHRRVPDGIGDESVAQDSNRTMSRTSLHAVATRPHRCWTHRSVVRDHAQIASDRGTQGL
jgi:threonine dehydrogenase-like Zn-dependent dehydrogenase